MCASLTAGSTRTGYVRTLPYDQERAAKCLQRKTRRQHSTAQSDGGLRCTSRTPSCLDRACRCGL
jgi:hypothetical protein